MEKRLSIRFMAILACAFLAQGLHGMDTWNEVTDWDRREEQYADFLQRGESFQNRPNLSAPEQLGLFFEVCDFKLEPVRKKARQLFEEMLQRVCVQFQVPLRTPKSFVKVFDFCKGLANGSDGSANPIQKREDYLETLFETFAKRVKQGCDFKKAKEAFKKLCVQKLKELEHGLVTTLRLLRDERRFANKKRAFEQLVGELRDEEAGGCFGGFPIIPDQDQPRRGQPIQSPLVSPVMPSAPERHDASVPMERTQVNPVPRVTPQPEVQPPRPQSSEVPRQTPEWSTEDRGSFGNSLFFADRKDPQRLDPQVYPFQILPGAFAQRITANAFAIQLPVLQQQINVCGIHAMANSEVLAKEDIPVRQRVRVLQNPSLLMDPIAAKIRLARSSFDSSSLDPQSQDELGRYKHSLTDISADEMRLLNGNAQTMALPSGVHRTIITYYNDFNQFLTQDARAMAQTEGVLIPALQRFIRTGLPEVFIVNFPEDDHWVAVRLEKMFDNTIAFILCDSLAQPLVHAPRGKWSGPEGRQRFVPVMNGHRVKISRYAYNKFFSDMVQAINLLQQS